MNRRPISERPTGVELLWTVGHREGEIVLELDTSKPL